MEKEQAANFKLSENFNLADLTYTNRAALQEENWVLDDILIQNLRNVAGLLEVVQEILEVPIKVTSGYRCPNLNKAVGSSDRSQHLKAEAADFIFWDEDIDLTEKFRVLWRCVRDGRLQVGQLIHETADRFYGSPSWIHISLGFPWREMKRCNQVLRFEHGKYELLGNP